MSRRSVNYDAVAPDYDQRTRQGSYLADIPLALQDLVRQVQAGRLLDLGCGTGRSLLGLAYGLQPSPRLYGLDFSAGMLAQARRLDPAYRLTQASAPFPPFATASFDLVFCVHAFHHFPDKVQVIRAAYDILRPGGVLAIINIDPHACQPGDWWVFDTFEGVRETDLQRFPSLAQQETMLREAGFVQINSPIVQYIDECVSGEAIFDNYWLCKDSCSQLILLSVEAYQAGVKRLRRRLAQAKAAGETVTFRTRLENRMCHGFKL